MNQNGTTVCEELVEWFYKLPPMEVVSNDIIATQIRDARIKLKTNDRGKAITNEDVTRMICACRRELELRKKTTLINVRNRGYKIVTGKHPH